MRLIYNKIIILLFYFAWVSVLSGSTISTDGILLEIDDSNIRSTDSNDPLIKEKIVTVQTGSSSAIKVRVPSEKRFDSNTFPTISFQLFNDSNVSHDLQFKVFLPRNWSILTLKTPKTIAQHKNERVRLTFSIPKDASADSTYYLGVVTFWDSHSDTSLIRVRVNPHRSIRLVTFPKEKQVQPGRMEFQKYVFKNDGNVTDTLFLKVDLPDDWDLLELSRRLVIYPRQMKIADLKYRSPEKIVSGARALIKLQVTVTADKQTFDSQELADNVGMIPKEKEIMDLLFKALDTARPVHQTVIRFSETAGVENRRDGIVARTNVHVLTPRKSIDRSLNPVLPVQIGFAVNRIEKEQYPDVALYIRTGEVDLGMCKAQIELTQRSNSVPSDEVPGSFTESVKFGLTAQNWEFNSGDVLVRTNPLQALRSSLGHADLDPYAEVGRGLYMKTRLNRTTLSFFRGKRIFTDKTLTYAEADIGVTEKFALSSSYLERKSSKALAMKGTFVNDQNLSITALTGITKSDTGSTPIGGAGQIRAHLGTRPFTFRGCLHWADRSYDGVDRGKYGVVVISRWIPSSKFYFWGNVHSYKQSWARVPGDSSAFVIDVKTQSMLHPEGWPVFHIGLGFQDKRFANGVRMKSKLLDFQIQHYLKLGFASLNVKYEDRYRREFRIQQEMVELRGSWLSYIKGSRFKLEQKLVRYDNGPVGYVSTVDMDLGFKGQTIGFFISAGKIWHRDWDLCFKENIITNMGIRTTFSIHPFGKNYHVRLEVGKYASEFEEFKSDWRVAVSLSAGTSPRFYVPVPFIKTRGRLQGEIFIDKNLNGIRDINEPGLSQVLLLLKGMDIMTDFEGRFESPSLEPGDYHLTIDPATIPAYVNFTGKIPEMISIRRGSIISLQIPMTSNCSFSGSLFLDRNSNLRYDTGETGIAMVRLIVKNERNQEWELFTDEKGYYSATDLLPGVYSVNIDTKWLPDRTVPGQPEFLVVLTPRESHQIVNLSVVRKELKIKKTFSTPK